MPAIAQALGSTARVGLRLERRREIAALAFTFSVEVYSRPVADDIRAHLIRDRPPGVRIEDLEEHEEENPGSHGTDLYSPVHAYIYRASGRFVGSPAGILELRRRVTGRDFVRIGELEIVAKSS